MTLYVPKVSFQGGQFILDGIEKKFHNNLSAYYNSGGLKGLYSDHDEHFLTTHRSFQRALVPVGCSTKVDVRTRPLR